MTDQTPAWSAGRGRPAAGRAVANKWTSCRRARDADAFRERPPRRIRASRACRSCASRRGRGRAWARSSPPSHASSAATRAEPDAGV
jgi:hypothetical protein